MAKKVFISYRRDDTAGAARGLYDRFSRLIGKDNVFLDVGGAIKAGEDYEAKISSAIGKADAIVALIGHKWMQPGPSGTPRLFDEDDHVRAEIRIALQGKALMLPVLVDHAPMPKPEQLPDDIADISRRNAPLLRYETFDRDAGHIVCETLGLPPGELPWQSTSMTRRIVSAVAGGILAEAALIAAAIAHWHIRGRELFSPADGPVQTEALAGGVLILGLIAGFLYGSRRRSIT